jgi:hypothetical protein
MTLVTAWMPWRRDVDWLMMNDADARRQTPGLRINNPGGMILWRWLKVGGNLSDRGILQVRVYLSIGSLSIVYILLCIGWSIFRSAGFPAWRERGVLFALTLDDFLMQIWAIFAHGAEGNNTSICYNP